MRMRTLAATATLAVLLIGLLAAPTAQGKLPLRWGLIEVEKTISLNFPAPGVYQGIVKAGKAKVERVATKSGRRGRANKMARRRAAKEAGRICTDKTQFRKVTVIHLSKPPFTIGIDSRPSRIAGARAAKYTVTGPQPPTGEKVLAKHFHGNFNWPTGPYWWRVICPTAKVIKPYPY